MIWQRTQAALSSARAVLSELGYAQTRVLETRTGLTLTPETARRQQRRQISTLNALYDWDPFERNGDAADSCDGDPFEDAWPSVS